MSTSLTNISFQVSQAPQPSSCELLLKILTRARSPRVYERARSICQFIVSKVAPSEKIDDESNQCLQYEILCWIDCMTADIVPEFCSILEDASQLHFKSDIYLLQAWKLANLPNPIPKLTVSPILMAALSSKSRNTKSRKMAKLLDQVTTKCLLYHDNPLPLAALVSYFHSVHHCTQLKTTLLHYSKSLVAFDEFTEPDREELLSQLISSTFSDNSFHSRVLRSVSNDDAQFKGLSHEETIAAIRQLLHMVACTNNEEKVESCVATLNVLLPAALKVGKSGSIQAREQTS